jgi:hypothetical protein
VYAVFDVITLLGMKFMYTMSIPPLAAIVLEPRFTHQTVEPEELVHPLSHQAYSGTPDAAGPVVNSMFCSPELSYEEYEDDVTVIICWKSDGVAVF